MNNQPSLDEELQRSTAVERVPRATSLVRQHTNVRVLVGDRIRGQSINPLLVSVAELDALITKLEHGPSAGMVLRLIPGQGASHAELTAAQQRIAASGLHDVIIMDPVPPPACARLTHKREQRNRMISEPTRVADNSYVAALLVDERCAEMEDHLTGMHLQGMLIIEAVRQMLLAVTEKYHLQEQLRGRCRFSTESLSITYLEFLFPLPTTLHFDLQIVRRVSDRNFVATGAVRFEQAGRKVVEAKVRFSVLDAAYVHSREELAFNERLTMTIDAALGTPIIQAS